MCQIHSKVAIQGNKRLILKCAAGYVPYDFPPIEPEVETVILCFLEYVKTQEKKRKRKKRKKKKKQGPQLENVLWQFSSRIDGTYRASDR